MAQAKRVLVTGAAGYIGSVLVRQLLDRGDHVLGLDCLLFGDHGVRDLTDHPSFELIKADLRSPVDYKEALGEVDSVVHLAALVGDPACSREPELAWETNFKASVDLLDEAKEAGVGRFIFVSTCSNYGRSESIEYCTEETELNPISLYARAKVEFERRLLGMKIPGMVPTCLRFATAYGPSPRMRFDLTVNEFSREVALQRPLEIYGQQFWRPYCHTTDLARACIHVLEADANVVDHAVFNVGNTEENYRKQDLAEILQKLRPEADIRFVHRDEDPRDYKVSFAKIERDLEFKHTVTVAEGIAEIFQLLEADRFPKPFADHYSNTPGQA
jgi:nucleoside-diphosphate-sugar epimerase